MSPSVRKAKLTSAHKHLTKYRELMAECGCELEETERVIEILQDHAPTLLGTLLNTLIRIKGFKQNEFALIAAIDKKTINQVINGKANISPEMAVALSSHLDVSAELLLKAQIKDQLHDLKPKEVNNG